MYVLGDTLRILVVMQMVQDPDQQHPDRLGKVDQPVHPWVCQDVCGVAQVCGHDGGVVILRENGTTMGQDDRIVIDVDHVRVRRDPLGDLMSVLGRRQPRAQVE
jgi:hypothetical protein